MLLLAEREPFPCSVTWKMEASGCLRTKAHRPFPPASSPPHCWECVLLSLGLPEQWVGSVAIHSPKGGLEGCLPGPVLLLRGWTGSTGTQCQPQKVSSSKPVGLILTQQLTRSGGQEVPPSPPALRSMSPSALNTGPSCRPPAPQPHCSRLAGPQRQ